MSKVTINVTIDDVIEGLRQTFDADKCAGLAEAFHERFLEVAKEGDRIRRKRKKTPQDDQRWLELLREGDFLYKMYHGLRPKDGVEA